MSISAIKVRLVGGKVLMVGGKVSTNPNCCCETPEDCCLYPASQVGVGYMAADLPDTVIFSKFLDPDVGTGALTKSGATYTGTITAPIGGSQTGTLSSNGTDWGWTPDGGEFEVIGPCLIGVYFEGVDEAVVEDEFPDTLTAQYGGYDPIEITRVNLCAWFGNGTTPEDLPYTITVSYGSTLEPYKWNACATIDGATPDCGSKDDPQSSPVGDYTTETTSVISVSL
jgi:hypothetical protein